MKIKIIASWLCRMIAALILLQTLYFKFSGHPESVELFTKLGVEPWGRVGTGIIELIASLLIIYPSTVFIGAALGIGLMSGAILSHLTVLGIESQGDGGQLFLYAIIVFLLCVFILWIHQKQGVTLFHQLFKRSHS